MHVKKWEVIVSFCTTLFIALHHGGGAFALILTTLVLAFVEWTGDKGLENQGICQGGLLIPWLLSALSTIQDTDQNGHLLHSILVSLLVCFVALINSSHPNLFLCIWMVTIVLCIVVFSSQVTASSMIYVLFAFSLFLVAWKFLRESWTLGDINICSQLLAYVFFSSCSFSVVTSVTREYLPSIVAKVISSSVVFSVLSSFLLRQWATRRKLSIIFVPLLCLDIFLVANVVLPLCWVIAKFAFSTQARCLMILYWILTLSLGLFITMHVKSKTIIIRKCFHFIACFLFVPALIFQEALLQVALSGAFALFCLIEATRLASIPTVSKRIDRFVRSFLDHRDKGPIVFSHFSLLLGLALPIWFTSTLSDGVDPTKTKILSFSGIVSLGIGDSFAAIIGTKYGYRRYIHGTKKSLEGSVACFLSCMGTWYLIRHVYPISLKYLTLPTLIATLFEATSTQNDNIYLPLYYASVLIILS